MHLRIDARIDAKKSLLQKIFCFIDVKRRNLKLLYLKLISFIVIQSKITHQFPSFSPPFK